MRCLTTIFYLTLGVYAHSQVNYHETWFDPAILCLNEPFIWDQFSEVQSLPPNDFESCIKPFEQVSRLWLRFEIKTQSNLAFEITPSNPDDDIDFALFESKEGVPTNLIRCVATGIMLDRSSIDQPKCTGATGISEHESDEFEGPGCDANQNNFVKYVTAAQGKEYMILITNYRSNNGFVLKWSDQTNISDILCNISDEDPNQLHISVNPNPANQEIKGQIESGTAQSATLILVGVNGSILDSRLIDLTSGTNDFQLSSSSSSSYPQGYYFLFLSNQDGVTAFTKFELAK